MTRSATCPDWRALAASRDGEDERSAGAWLAGLEHLDGGCRACRDAAYAADPTLVFRRAPRVEITPDEIVDLTASVRAMIRAERVDRAADAPRADDIAERLAPPSRPRRPAIGWRVASLAAGLVALLVGTVPRPAGQASPPERTVASPAVYDTLLSATYGAGKGGIPTLQAGPVEIETLDHPSANVYQFDDPGMAVVLIVDAGLDV